MTRKSEKLIAKLLAEHVVGIRFRELLTALQGHGYRLLRIKGSHHILVHPMRPQAFLNLQPDRDGTVKPYQARQVRKELRELARMEDR